MVRKLDRRGYSLHISEVMNDYPGEDKQIAAGYINKVIEREILRAPSSICGYTVVLKPSAGRTFRLLTFPHRLRFQKSRQLG